MARTTWQYRPGFGWVERHAADEFCPITGIRHQDTALWYDDDDCRICGQSFVGLVRYRELVTS